MNVKLNNMNVKLNNMNVKLNNCYIILHIFEHFKVHFSFKIVQLQYTADI